MGKQSVRCSVRERCDLRIISTPSLFVWITACMVVLWETVCDVSGGRCGGGSGCACTVTRYDYTHLQHMYMCMCWVSQAVRWYCVLCDCLIQEWMSILPLYTGVNSCTTVWPYLEKCLWCLTHLTPLHRRLRQAEEYMFSFEVFCLHKRSTPTSKAISQSKRLVEKFVRTFSSNPVYGLLS